MHTYAYIGTHIFEHLICSRHMLGRVAGTMAIIKERTGKASLRSCPGLEGSKNAPTGYLGEHSRQREPLE